MTLPRQWQIQEAKSRLSALITEAQRAGPQAITRHGRPVAVLLSADDFERLRSHPKTPLVEFLASVPLAELDLGGRDAADFAREVDL